MGLPCSSAGKEATCNAGDPGLIPGLGRSAGEGIGYLLQSSWASLVTQLVKNPPAMWETWVLFLGWEDPLEKGKATHSSILAWRIPWTVESIGSQRIWRDFHFHFSWNLINVDNHFLAKKIEVEEQLDYCINVLVLSLLIISVYLVFKSISLKRISVEYTRGKHVFSGID